MIIATHQAEKCLNDLHRNSSPWFASERIEIIKRHMEAFAQRDQKVAALEAEIESERDANSVLTEEIEALQDEIDLKRACIKGMGERAETLHKDLTFTQEWFATRFERLKDLARTLPEPKQTEFFSILANGKGDPTEPPSYALQMTLLRHDLDRLAGEIEKLHRGEFICRKCGLRKNADRSTSEPDF